MSALTKESVLAGLEGRYADVYRDYMEVKQAGKELAALCPFHDDHHPSMKIDPATGLWNCFVCNFGGDVFEFIMRKENVKFPEALALLGDKIGITQSPLSQIVACYDYSDEQGNLLYQVVRKQPKSFYQRHPDGNNGWTKNLKGVRLVPYRLPEVIAAAHKGEPIFIFEGEKDADKWRAHTEYTATCNSGGAGKWQDDFKRFFQDAVVYIIPDNDKPGREHARSIARSLAGIAKVIKVLELPGLPEKGDVSDWLSTPNLQVVTEINQIIAQTPEFDPTAEWEPEPVRKTDRMTELASEWGPVVSYAAPNLPAFPLEALPPAIRDYVGEVSASVQVPPELPAMLALSAIGAAGCRSCVAQVGRTHAEPLNLWTATVMPPGSRKSAAVQAMVFPIEEYEREQGQLVKEEIKEATEQRKLDEARMKQRREKAAASEGPSDPYDPADLTEIPTIPRFLVDDTTTQQLATLIAENGAMAIFSAEGGILDIIAGRYSKDKGTDMDLYLKGHAGESYRVDRKGRPPEYIPRVLLTMGLAVQPAVLTSLTSQPSFQGRGLLARFLYSQPESLVGTRLYQDRPVDAGAKARYCAAIRRLLSFNPSVTQEGELDWHNLMLTGSALDLWAQYADAIECRQAEGGDLAGVSEWASKLAGAVARIAGGFHLVENAQHPAPWNFSISKETVAAAWAVGEEYLIPQALAAFEMMGADPSENVAKRVLRWIERKRQIQFSWRDCHKDHPGLNSEKELRPALKALCERGYLREVVPGSASNGSHTVGRPKSEQYLVNPLWLTLAAK
jgi:hypothetical protein